MYYRVSMYLYKADSPSLKENEKKEFVQSVIVKKGFISSKEICSGKKLIMLPDEETIHKYIFHDELFVFEKDFSSSNLVSEREVTEYIDSFDGDKFEQVLAREYKYKKAKQRGIKRLLKGRK